MGKIHTDGRTFLFDIYQYHYSEKLETVVVNRHSVLEPGGTQRQERCPNPPRLIIQTVCVSFIKMIFLLFYVMPVTVKLQYAVPTCGSKMVRQFKNGV